jgi:hypothetical protein
MFWGAALTEKEPFELRDDGKLLYITKAVLVQQQKGRVIVELATDSKSL